MAKMKLEKSAISNTNISLRKIKSLQNLSAKEVKNSGIIDDSVKHDNGYRFLKSVGFTPAFSEAKKKHALSLIRHSGVPTYFITLSASEIKWPELIQLLYKLKTGKIISNSDALYLDLDIKTKLIRHDPVTCVRYFEN